MQKTSARSRAPRSLTTKRLKLLFRVLKLLSKILAQLDTAVVDAGDNVNTSGGLYLR